MPQYAICMRSSHFEESLDWHNYQLFIFVPITLIIGTNILFDFEDIPTVSPSRLLAKKNTIRIPMYDDSRLKTSCISCLFISTVMFPVAFFKYVDAIRIHLVFFLIKGPLTAIWTHHRLKQKNQQVQQKEDVELTRFAQAQQSELESGEACFEQCV